uniref:SET domain-containing protein n=1 Tax=Panagrellus redivivus TaxID=6233 RepID=A0A7E4VY47_PANRE
MAPRRKAAGNHQQHASKVPVEQPGQLKQQMCVVRQYRTAQEVLLDEMRANLIPKPKKLLQKREKRVNCNDIAMNRRSNRPRETSKRVGSPFIVPDYQRKLVTIKVEKDATHTDTVKQESHVPTMPIQQQAANSDAFDNPNFTPPQNLENAGRRTKRQIGTQPANFQHPRRQQQQLLRAPYDAGTMRQKRTCQAVSQADNMENAASPLGSVLAFLNIEKAATNVSQEPGTQTSPVPFKPQQVDAPIDVIQIDDDDDGIVEAPTSKHLEGRQIVRFTKCATLSPELRIQCRGNPHFEHVYSLKKSPWFAVSRHYCLTCCNTDDQAFVRPGATRPETGEFTIFEGGTHGEGCARPFQPEVVGQNVRIYENRLFVKADNYFLSEDRTKLVVFRAGGNIEFTVENSYARYNRYTANCVGKTPAIVTRSSVYVNYGHFADCPIRHRVETGNGSVGVADLTRLALKAKISGRPNVLKVIRPKRNFPGRRRLSATIDEVIEHVIHPPAKDTDRAASVEIIEVRQSEARLTMAPANPESCPMTVTKANAGTLDFSPLGSNLSIASSFADSGFFSTGQLSHRPSVDFVNAAPRRASDPEVANIGPDVVNPMDWLKHRLSLPLDGNSGNTVDEFLPF